MRLQDVLSIIHYLEGDCALYNADTFYKRYYFREYSTQIEVFENKIIFRQFYFVGNDLVLKNDAQELSLDTLTVKDFVLTLNEYLKGQTVVNWIDPLYIRMYISVPLCIIEIYKNRVVLSNFRINYNCDEVLVKNPLTIKYNNEH